MISATRQRSDHRADEKGLVAGRKDEPATTLKGQARRTASALQRSRAKAALARKAAVPVQLERHVLGDLSRDAGTVHSGAPESANLHASLRSSNFQTHMHGTGSPIADLVQGALEQEKARISRELHDEVVQMLFAMKIDCAWLCQNLTNDPAASMQKLASMQRLLEGSAASVRRIAAGLRPQLLEDAGFVPAVQWLARDFTERTGSACDVEISPGLQIEDPHASTVFRIIQEALSNVRKHACASHARVKIRAVRGVLHVEVEDDGKGFSVQGARRADAMGLSGLRERARLLDGEITLTSMPGAGTVVRARIPLPQAACGAPMFATVGEAHALQ